MLTSTNVSNAAHGQRFNFWIESWIILAFASGFATAQLDGNGGLETCHRPRNRAEASEEPHQAVTSERPPAHPTRGISFVTSTGALSGTRS